MNIAIGRAMIDKADKYAFSRIDMLVVLAMTAAGRLLYYVLGLYFDASTLSTYMQFIDRELLTNQLIESLWYYHANPPLLNLTTGLALKLFGEHAPLALSVVFHALGGLLALAIFAVIEKLSRSRVAAYALTALMVFSPAFVLYENWLMYTFPTAAMLGISVYLLMRYVESGEARWGTIFFASLALIALTRSMFHLAWAIVITGGLAFSMRHQAKQVLFCAAVPLLMVVGWYGKNYYLFGTFSASSWMGLGLSNITTLTVPRDKLKPLVEQGALSEYALVSRYEDRSQLFVDVDPSEKRIRVLHSQKKSTGESNFNYVGLIDINTLYTHDALKTVIHFPVNYLKAVTLSNRLFFSPTSMNAYFTVENRVAAAPMEMWYNPLIYGAKLLPTKTEQPHFGYTGKYFLEVNTGIILVIGLPLLLLYALTRIAYGITGKAPVRPIETIILTYLVFNILYTYSLGTLLELGENYRYRFVQEPLFLIVLGFLIGDLIRLRRRWSATGFR